MFRDTETLLIVLCIVMKAMASKFSTKEVSTGPRNNLQYLIYRLNFVFFVANSLPERLILADWPFRWFTFFVLPVYVISNNFVFSQVITIKVIHCTELFLVGKTKEEM